MPIGFHCDVHEAALAKDVEPKFFTVGFRSNLSSIFLSMKILLESFATRQE